MRPFVINPLSKLKGKIFIIGDKSIAHRALIISAISRNKTTIDNLPASKDLLSTIRILKKLGIKITREAKKNHSSIISVYGRGLYGLKKPNSPVSVGESGTTLRLILGVLAGQNFLVKLNAGKSLSLRPMLRVTRPLRLMGAKIKARCIKRYRYRLEEYPPITIKGGSLRGITYNLPVASAQVKSAILLAGLYAKGETHVIEPLLTRDHTERMLNLFKADLKVNKNKIVIKKAKELSSPGRLVIPGDISSAAFFIVLATILPESDILIREVSLNSSRLGLIRVLKRMGADIKLSVSSSYLSRFEPIGSIQVKNSFLKGIIVKKGEIPSLIDELPILMVAACFARGSTILEGVGELRVKETDRIKSMSENLKKMGSRISVKKINGVESIVIQGKAFLRGCKLKSFNDHRTAMSMIVAGLSATEKSQLDDISCINKSFPNFLHILHSLRT